MIDLIVFTIKMIIDFMIAEPLIALVIILYIFWVPIIRIIKNKIIKNKIMKLSSKEKEITPHEFFKIKNSKQYQSKTHISTYADFSGIYILFNKTKNMYYVGQSKHVLQRVNQHLTAHGNGDVYADYKYGDEFTIKMIALKDSGYHSLDDLERHAINAYKAKSKGYNKNNGNNRYKKTPY